MIYWVGYNCSSVVFLNLYAKSFSFLDVFQHDPNYVENEQKYQAVKNEILGSDADENGDSSDGDDEDDGSEEDEEESEEKSNIVSHLFSFSSWLNFSFRKCNCRRDRDEFDCASTNDLSYHSKQFRSQRMRAQNDEDATQTRTRNWVVPHDSRLLCPAANVREVFRTLGSGTSSVRKTSIDLKNVYFYFFL